MADQVDSLSWQYRFFDKAMLTNSDPEQIAIDKSGASKSANDAINAGGSVVRQIKYLNNIVEQDPRSIKRVTVPMPNFKSCRPAGCVFAGIEPMHMIPRR